MFDFDVQYFKLPNPCFYIKCVVVRLKDYKLRVRLHMFWEHRKKTPIMQEIEEFAEDLKHQMTTQGYVRHLHKFVRVTGIRSSKDITIYDMEAYTEAIERESHSEYQRLSALNSITKFMKYKQVKAKKSAIKRPIGRPPKQERNERMLQLKEQGFSFGAIARRYKLKSKKSVFTAIKSVINKRQIS